MDAYAVLLPGRQGLPEKAVLLRHMTVKDMLMAARTAPAPKQGAGMGEQVASATDLMRAALRLSVVKIGTVDEDGAITWTRDVNQLDLIGNKWNEVFPRSRETFQMIAAFNKTFMPDETTSDRVLRGLEWDESSDPNLVTVTVAVPDLGQVVLRELNVDAVARVMRVAGRERSPAAADLLQTMEAVRESLVSVDGKEIPLSTKAGGWPLSIAHTYLLGRVWRVVHVGDDDPGNAQVQAIVTSGT